MSTPSLASAGHGSPPDEEPSLPRLFGAYTLLKRLGRGGMGEVFLARKAAFAGAEKLCVVKCLRELHDADEEYIARFFDEARTAVRLAHRNICRVFDVANVAEVYYLAMDYVPGRDLGTVYRRARERGITLPPAVTLHLIAEVLEALDYVHRLADGVTLEPLHLVHRDVSPQNVMVTFDGEVKLIDFGLAQSRLKQQETQTGIVMGKIAYMSPEQARAQDVDRRCDLYATAVLAYELLRGERFYGEMTMKEIWSVAGSGYRPKGLDELAPELSAVLTKALAPLPKHRFATCEAFRHELLGVAARAGLMASSSDLADVMSDLFPAEGMIDAQERLQLTRMAAPVTAPRAAPPSSELGEWESTETMTVASQEDDFHSGARPPVSEVEPATMLFNDDEQTVPMSLTDGPGGSSPLRPGWWVIGVVALGVLAAALALLLVL